MNFRTNPTKGQEEKQVKRMIRIENHIQKDNHFTLTCYSWVKLALLKQMIRDRTGIPVSDMRLIMKNIELNRNNLDIQDYDVKKDAIIKLLPKVTLQGNKYMINAFDILEDSSPANTQFLDIKCQVEAALNTGIIPKLTDFGTQGTYFLEGLQRNPLAIFKPQDEEAFAPNNPRGYIGKFSSPGLRAGVLSGEGVDREVAAFLIDQAYGGYHKVPITTYIEFCHPSFKSEEFVIYQSDSQKTEQINENVPSKRGSLQLFMKHQDNAGNFGSSLFSVDQAHKIAILDLRIFNCDRNEENILVRKRPMGQKQREDGCKQSYDFVLIPIDHGYSFPDSFRVSQDEVVWFHWSQMQQPFSQKELSYISKIDPLKDVELIRKKLKFREICLRNFRIAEIFLKEGAENGLTLFHIAQLAFREDPDEMSHLEKSVQSAEQNYELNLVIPAKINGKVSKHNSPVPQLLKYASSDQKSSFKMVDDKSLLKMDLMQISEERDSIGEEQKMEDFKLWAQAEADDSPRTNDSLIIKRSISQPTLLQSQKSIINDGQGNINGNKVFTEDFYPHVTWFIQLLIKQKKMLIQGSQKKVYRERFSSENL